MTGRFPLKLLQQKQSVKSHLTIKIEVEYDGFSYYGN